MRTVTNVIAQLDKPSEDVTEIRVFRLKHADPTEVAEELGNLFPSSNSSSDQNGRTMGFQFGLFATAAIFGKLKPKRSHETPIQRAGGCRSPFGGCDRDGVAEFNAGDSTA